MKFWNGQNVYAINMGQGGEFLYGPVTSWAIKMNNANSASRGWVWGADGLTPSASLSVGGKMQIASDFRCMGNIGVQTTSPAHPLHVEGESQLNGNVGIGGAPISNMSLFNNAPTQQYGIHSWATSAGSIGADIRGGSRGVLAVANVSVSGGPNPNEVYGVWGSAVNGNQLTVGVHGDALGIGQNGDYAYGVWGSAYFADNGNYGVLGDALGTNAFAGYFNGDVYTTGAYLPSDRHLKDNIEALKNPSEKLMQLRPSVYNYKTEAFPRMHLAEGKQMGFIAQEVQEVLPELVREAMQPPKIDEDGKLVEEGIRFNAINYVGLIPLLTATVQEQQGVIETQKESIAALEARIEALEHGMTGSKAPNMQIDPHQQQDQLFQNTPNPFSDETVIRYTLKSAPNTAQLMIFNMNGQMISSRDLELREEGKVVIRGHEMEAGMYIYTLVVDGQEVDSRRMILTN